jgi:hypothetical protein
MNFGEDVPSELFRGPTVNSNSNIIISIIPAVLI